MSWLENNEYINYEEIWYKLDITCFISTLHIYIHNI